MRDIAFISAISISSLLLIASIIVVIIRINVEKGNRKVAYGMLDTILEDVKNDILPLVIEFAKNINIDDYKKNTEDEAKIYNDILNDISDFIFNRSSEKTREFIDKYKDKKVIYTLLNSLFDDDVINDLVITIKDNKELNDILTDIYNSVFDERIKQIELEDKELEVELSEYENAPIKDETIEQHNQSIEEYAKAHLEEKIQELNEVYDELEETIPNTVPVRDLSALAPLIDDQEIIPPVDDEPDTVSADDDTIEILEYLDDNITDNSLSTTDDNELGE